MRRATRLAAACVLLATVACAGRQAPAGDAPDATGPTTVLVENRSWWPQTIYVARDGHRLRLGQVQAAGTETFLLPESLLLGPTRLRFIADPVGVARAASSQDYLVVPGDQVRLIIPSS
jgi:hypothetical protein